MRITYYPDGVFMKNYFTRFFQREKAIFAQGGRFGYLLELLPVLFLTSFVTGPYLDFRPNYFPVGYEFNLVTVSHYIWNFLPECGSCVLWNGLLNGGMPAFAELHGAVLHPLVIISTLLWGVINGSKIIVFCSLLVSGIAIWWLAKELGASRISRIWISLFGVIGGHVVGRLEAGNIVLVLSIAFATLIFPMVLRLNRAPTRRNMAYLAILLSMTWLSGQGYIQVGLVAAWFPAFLYLLYDRATHRQEKWILFGKALALSGLICAVLFLPAAHFMSAIDKFTMDGFKDLQPLKYIPLNLVISDRELYRHTFLGMDGFPYEHLLFIGWIPVIFAVISIFFIQKQADKKPHFTLFISILLTLIITSWGFSSFFNNFFPILSKLRALSVATALMVPPILALAAMGLDRLAECEWPLVISKKEAQNTAGNILSTKWLILVPILVISIVDLNSFSKNYITLRHVEVPKSEINFVQLVETQWVNPPNQDWFPTLLNEKRKLILTDRPWVWKDRYRLYGYVDLVPNPNNDEIKGRVSRQKNFDVVMRPEETYASIQTETGSTDCRANSSGGNIDVSCNNTSPGTLIVREYQWSGWTAWRDGKRVNLLGGDWLSVEAPAGNHVYSFRFIPWDVYLGAIISLLGIGLVIYILIKKESELKDEQQKKPIT